MKKVLFVCEQNRGRSQIAATLFNKYMPRAHADSAGTIVATPGDTLEERSKVSPAVVHVVAVLKEEGIDASQNIQTQVREDMLPNYDKVVVMAAPQTIPTWLSQSPKFEYWLVEDTAGKHEETIRNSKNEIKAKVQKLIQELE